MMGYIWGGMIVAAVLFGAVTGQTEAVAQASLDGAKAAVEMAFGLLGMMCFWSGLLEVAKRAGLTEKLARCLRPLTRLLFPHLSSDSPAMTAMVMNMTANFLGLSNAATPLGLAAMIELQKVAPQKGRASDEMCTFVVINTASISLIPTTVIALRSAAGSSDPFAIIVPVWICSVAAKGGGCSMLRTLSAGIMPVIFCVIIGYAAYCKIDIFDAFLAGAAAGLKTLFGILPALVGLVAAITMFRASGALDFLTALLTPVTRVLGIPAEIMPLALLRPVSGSGALAVVNNLLTANGPDSIVGRIASVVMGSTETTFYTLAVYYGSVGIRDSRYTVPAALLADVTGLLAGTWICRLFFT